MVAWPMKREAPERVSRGGLTVVAVGLIRIYRVTLSPLLGPRCRFLPTCSQYAIDAIHDHGLLRGAWLAVRRIVRCHPFGGSGYDPVPSRTEPRR